jgi:alanyl-tRNA synthetase
MKPTVKLYDEDPYLAKFVAEVKAVNGNEVVLDRTAFYPESGGQAGDTGRIGGIEVADTQIHDGVISHILASPLPFNVGSEVECVIDYDRRHRIMRLHSAAHIMEHFLWAKMGYLERLGSYVDEKKDRADYTYEGRLPAEALHEVEGSTNAFLAEGHEIRIESDPSLPGIRIWRCADIEMHCAGTHVRDTGEIGEIRLKRKNPGKGKERVETSLA